MEQEKFELYLKAQAIVNDPSAIYKVMSMLEQIEIFKKELNNQFAELNEMRIEKDGFEFEREVY